MGKRNNILYSQRVGIFFVAPAAILLFLNIVFPMAYAFKLSFFKGNVFNGFDNYVKAFTDIEVWQALGHTLYFSVFSVAAHLVIGLFIALLLNSVTAGKALLRILILIPWMIAPVVTATTWRWILNEHYGIVNAMLIAVGILKEPVPWLSSIQYALPAVTIANIWMRFPYVMIMLFAGLQGIPEDLYEAASVDGANWLRQLFSITIPSLKYIIILTTLLDFVHAFRLFDLSSVMTGGGPINASEVISLFVYRHAFQYIDFNYSSAVAMIVFFITTIFSVVYLRLIGREGL
jgi:multiple sugar transport system permease protein